MLKNVHNDSWNPTAARRTLALRSGSAHGVGVMTRKRLFPTMQLLMSIAMSEQMPKQGTYSLGCLSLLVLSFM